jgi:hypothetical protein
MNALLGIVSINLSLLASPNLTEEGSAAFVKCPSNKNTEENCVNWLQEAIRFVTVFNEGRRRSLKEMRCHDKLNMINEFAYTVSFAIKNW